jgi:hypothetical protein
MSRFPGQESNAGATDCGNEAATAALKSMAHLLMTCHAPRRPIGWNQFQPMFNIMNIS